LREVVAVSGSGGWLIVGVWDMRGGRHVPDYPGAWPMLERAGGRFSRTRVTQSAETQATNCAGSSRVVSGPFPPDSSFQLLLQHLVQLLVDLGLDRAFQHPEQQRQVDLDADLPLADLDRAARPLGGASRSLEDDSVALPPPIEVEALLHRA